MALGGFIVVGQMLNVWCDCDRLVVVISVRATQVSFVQGFKGEIDLVSIQVLHKNTQTSRPPNDTGFTTIEHLLISW